MVKQLLTVWPLIQKGFWIFPKIIMKRFRVDYRGSLKDPLVYLGVISFVMFGFYSLGSPFLLNSSLNNSSSLLSFLLPISERSNNGNLFLGQENVQKFNFSLFNIIQGNSLLGASVPINISPQVLGVLSGEAPEEDLPEQRNEIIEYTVQAGDTLSVLTERFGISLNTLLWANDLSKSSKLKVGQKLVILPVSGLIHHVKGGETTGGLAELYKSEADEIILFNDLSETGNIVVGDILIIPGGERPILITYTSAPEQVPLASSYFICPIGLPCTITQGLHWYNAIDFTHGKCGDSIYAAAQGTVLKVKYGWNGGAGNFISILHPNGAVTTYGHIASSLVNVGQTVSQGQMIATIGGKPGTPGAGTSTGCHVHFAVKGARNPFAR